MRFLTEPSRSMIAVLLIAGLLLLDCSRTRTLRAPAELDTEKSYQALIKKKVRVYFQNNKMVEGYLFEVSNDSITIRAQNLEPSIRIARRDVNHIEVFETDNSVLVASAIVLVLLIMYFSVQGLAAGIPSAGH